MKYLKTAICLEVLIMGVILLLHFLMVETNTDSFYKKEQVELVQAGADINGMAAKTAGEEVNGTETSDAEKVDAKRTNAKNARATDENIEEDSLEATADIMLPQAREIIRYAEQFVGNPYVWGGTSLTEGADCSGFVQAIYKEFGISLPRTSREQAVVGEQISMEEVRPGDLIFYAEDGVIYHVIIYTGDGQSVQAMSSEAGIVTAPVEYENAVWAVRVLED